MFCVQISADDKLPQIIRQRGPRTATEDDKKEFADLFESESDEDDDNR